jgi:FkbM family methyltransferase
VTNVSRVVSRLHRLKAVPRSVIQSRRYRLVRVPPCYDVRDVLNSESVVVDCGLGPDADFSQAIIQRYGCCCYGFDPTRRHWPALSQVAAESNGKFGVSHFAIGAECGVMSFHESLDNVSGSLYMNHCNVRNDRTRHYDVQTVTLAEVLRIIGESKIDLLKLDIEGAEYDVLEGATDCVLDSINQIIVEFHDHCLESEGVGRKDAALVRLSRMGFTSHTRDSINYLFFRP